MRWVSIVLAGCPSLSVSIDWRNGQLERYSSPFHAQAELRELRRFYAIMFNVSNSRNAQPRGELPPPVFLVAQGLDTMLPRSIVGIAIDSVFIVNFKSGRLDIGQNSRRPAHSLVDAEFFLCRKSGHVIADVFSD